MIEISSIKNATLKAIALNCDKDKNDKLDEIELMNMLSGLAKEKKDRKVYESMYGVVQKAERESRPTMSDADYRRYCEENPREAEKDRLKAVGAVLLSVLIFPYTIYKDYQENKEYKRWENNIKDMQNECQNLVYQIAEGSDAKSVAKFLDKADGKQNNQISSQAWNTYINTFHYGHSKIRSYIDIYDATRSLEQYME